MEQMDVLKLNGEDDDDGCHIAVPDTNVDVAQTDKIARHCTTN